jgi:hypothetical protein
MKQKFANALSLALIVAMLLTSVALADQINADADALVLSAPSPNGITATQASGTTASYDFSAIIRNTGNTANDVFAASSDTVSVTITKGGSWVSGGTSGPWSFTTYESPQAGTIEISVPCGSQGTTSTMTVTLSATASNGRTLSPDSRQLSYTITAGPDDAICAPSNSAPSVDAGGPYSGTEGSAIALNATVTDDDAPSLAWTYSTVSADAGVSCSFSDASMEDPTFTCTDDGTFTVTLTADDGVNAPVSHSAGVTVSNANPVVGAVTNSGPISEGSSATITVTAHDPGSNDTLSYAYDCDNNGSYESSTGSCSFADNVGSPFMVGVQVSDDDGGSATGSTGVTVNNANPVVAAPSWASASVACRAAATLTNISFSDAGVIDYPWTVDINWNDGSTNFTTNTQGAQGNQTHTYNTPGSYSATVTVTDKDGGSGSNTSGPLTVRQTYTVNFLQPFDNASPSNLITNTMKSGRTVPVKVTIYDDCAQAYVNDPATLVRINLLASGSTAANDAVEVYADAGTSNGNTLYFRWTSDPAAPGGGFWIYNLDSRTALNGSALAINTTYRVDVFVGTVKATESKWALLKPVK